MPSFSPLTFPAASIYRRVGWRIIPILFLCYIAAYLDRVNLGFAKLQMQSDLHFSDAVYGFGSGIFFVGYFLFEVPSNILLEKVGAHLWIARIMISWGLVSALTMFTHSEWVFYAFRFALGAAEAGFFPGVILYLTYWFPSKQRARIVAFFMMAVAVTGVIGGPLSGWIMSAFSRSEGLRAWQMLFLLEGLPSVLLGLLVPFLLPRGIRSARWLSSDEQAFLEEAIHSEDVRKTRLPLASLFTHPTLFLYSAIYFFCAGGLYVIGFWLPQLIKNTGISDPFLIGCLTVIPYGLAAIGMVLFSRSSDHHLERRWHFATAAFLGAFGLVISGYFGHSTVLAMIGFSIATIGIHATLPLFWPMPTAFLAGSSAAAGIALINSVANLGGFYSPVMVGWLTSATHRSDSGLYLVAATLFFDALLVLFCVPKVLPADVGP